MDSPDRNEDKGNYVESFSYFFLPSQTILNPYI